MRHIKPLHVAFLFVSTIVFTAATATRTLAADDYLDDYRDVGARVARISLLRGNVSLRRSGNSEWEEATINLPLVEGDQLATGSDARLEIQIDARNFVRIDEDSVLQVVTLRDEGVALSLAEGTATLRLARFDRDREYFEIDAPKTTVAAEMRGLYRLDVRGDGRVRITVRDDGRARIYSETSGFTLRDGRSAELFYDGAEAGDWQMSSLPMLDDWDRWTDERERFLLARLRYEQRERYYDQDVWGAEELDAYGDWAYADHYGWVWRPSPTYISSYHDWSPYRYGHWRWFAPYGWTWVGDEPWGWAPYHYGRWVYYNNSWCWAPRGYGYNYGRSRWRPALVVFVFHRDSQRENIAWYPLGYGQRDPVHHWDGRPVPPARSKSDDRALIHRADSDYLRGVTTLPAGEFGKRGARGRPTTKEIAQSIITTEPVRGALPVRPANIGSIDRADKGKGGRGIVVPPPAGVPPARPLPPQRRTGAMARKPGVALDKELQRTRIQKGHEPRPVPSTDSSRVNKNGEGARPLPPVTRPPVVTDESKPPPPRLDPSRERPAPPPVKRQRPETRERPPAPAPRQEPPPPRKENKQPPPPPEPSRERNAPVRPEKVS
jgi:FecR protein